MLQSLHIRNYALIQKLEIDFKPGFSTVTGETGAGKSIILGALSLILGQRADTSVLKDKSVKCIVEGIFDITKYQLKDFFTANNLDYEKKTIIRREIVPDGKSRAFINDTPATLAMLKELGSKLIDVHSQHQNLMLGDNQFQMNVVDAFTDHKELLNDYRKTHKEYKSLSANLEALTETAAKARADLDYYQFQFNQLDEARLAEHEQQELEAELETLAHAEEIKTRLTAASQLLSGEGSTITFQVKELKSAIDSLNKFFHPSSELSDRIESLYIELKELANDVDRLETTIENNPARVETINERLDLIYSLQQKHRVNTVAELIGIKNSLDKKISEIVSYDDEIGKLEKQLETCKGLLEKSSCKITANRKKAAPVLEEKVTELLSKLGMPNASFKVNLVREDTFLKNGCDCVNFLFSANKNSGLQDIAKIASGGEISRVMFTIKFLISQVYTLPTIIFDEIDSGVSGDIADKMGTIMQKMAASMQVIGITHLPQIASKGNHHYLVFKHDTKDTTMTGIKLLDKDERVTEIAKMLSGKKLTEAAMNNAMELLKN